MSLVGNATGSVAVALSDHGGPTDDALVVKHLGSISVLLQEERREDHCTAVDCSRTAEGGRGRQAPVIVLDLGRVCFRAERWGEKGGRLFFSFTAQPLTLGLFLSFLSCEETAMECVY